MIEKTILGTYKNGNYTSTIYSDGSRDRVTEGDSFIPSFPESIELKITNEYDGEYPWFNTEKPESYVTAKIMETELEPIRCIKSIRPLTEVTIGAGFVDHPEILNLLFYFRQKKILSRIVVGQDQFMKNFHRLLNWFQRGLMKSIGIVLIDSDDTDFISKLSFFPGATIIVTSGIFNGNDLDNLEPCDINLLIKGYTSSEHNREFTDGNILDFGYNRSWMIQNIDSELIPAFNKVSFDNLALSELGILDDRFVKKDEDHNEIYLGNDGDFSLYIDLVKGEFSRSGYSKERYAVGDQMTTDQMFREIRKRRRI